MSAILLLPGFGGKYTSEAIAGGGTGADVIDCSRASSLLFECTAHSGNATTITVQQSLDGVNWITLTTFAASAGTTKALDPTKGPFGLIRFTVDGTTGTDTVQFAGFPLQITN